MKSREYQFHDGRKGAALAIRVIPGAKRNEISEIREDGSIKVRLTAPPIEGRANAALIEFLAYVLDVPRTRIEIVAGEHQRDKLVSILDIEANTVQEKILKAMG